jgi:hypothetical protein
MLLVVDDPDVLVERAAAAGATVTGRCTRSTAGASGGSRTPSATRGRSAARSARGRRPQGSDLDGGGCTRLGRALRPGAADLLADAPPRGLVGDPEQREQNLEEDVEVAVGDAEVREHAPVQQLG